jgi:uncharacterized protein (UPF0264 family)
MVRLLVSVCDVDEALAAAAAGADFIDLKDPAAGALGGLSIARIADIAGALRARHPALPVSATIGDLASERLDEILARVRAVAGCGVDYVKVGVVSGASQALAAHSANVALLHELARCDADVVPVFIVDRRIAGELVDAALCQVALGADHAFPALMLDTEDKRGGSLLQRLPRDELARFVAIVRAAGRLAGLAGALRADDAAALLALAPDFAGFRSAVCEGSRAGRLDAGRVRDLRRRLAADAHADGPVPLAS